MNLALDFGTTAPTAAVKLGTQALALRFSELLLQEGSPVRAVRHLPAKAASFAPYPEQIDGLLRTALAKRGVEQLYTHQAAAVQNALDGRNVVVVTPTASGKTLCYNLPVVHAVLQNPAARAIYLFPTKALAEDQRLELQRLNNAIGTPFSCH